MSRNEIHERANENFSRAPLGHVLPIIQFPHGDYSQGLNVIIDRIRPRILFRVIPVFIYASFLFAYGSDPPDIFHCVRGMFVGMECDASGF